MVVIRKPVRIGEMAVLSAQFDGSLIHPFGKLSDRTRNMACQSLGAVVSGTQHQTV